ncbi:single-stranded-DNA-specific exonuclease RecJ [Patescibacteria group bacterium]|nr:single-stranded-DNA-specific exonuclease RecJ [Patescibacteria group bacterium]
MKSNWLAQEKFKEGFGGGWGYNEIVLQLLWNLGIKSKESAGDFLNPKYENLGDPFLFPDMKRAIERIFLSKKNDEKIFVYGDYDADGVSASVILRTILKAYGMEPEIYIPHREKEGYGMNKEAVDYINENGGKLIITCDCGISNAEEVSYAKEKGVDVIITDHHTLPLEMPKEAYAIIHAQIGDYPFKELSGGGVAFKLAQGILKSAHELAQSKLRASSEQTKEGTLRQSSGQREALEKWLLDLVAISTIGDMMPLADENRVLVKFGLKVLNKTKRLGLQKLIEAASLNPGKLDTYSVGFQIAPRINAAGRMDHANVAYELLIEEDEKKAEELATKLNQNNSERQKQTEIIVKEATYQVVEKEQEKEYCLFAFKPDWPLGLLGLAAGHLSRKFNRPAVILTESGGKIKGSARGIDQFNLIEALQKIEDLFEAYGGHPGAAGLTLKREKLEEFEKKLLKLAKKELQDKELISYLKVNDIALDDVNMELAEQIGKFEPFGMENRRPMFLSREVEICGADTIGNGEKHLRLTVKGSGVQKYKMIGFCFEHFCAVPPKIGEKYDIVYEIGVNEWNGREELQLKIVDMEKSV